MEGQADGRADGPWMEERLDEHSRGKERLFAGLYHELHRLAQRALRRDGRLLTISATTLLHESYLSIPDARFPDSERFLAYAARTMRGLIIDAVRRRATFKHGAAFVITSFDADSEAPQVHEHELMHLHDALDALAAEDPAMAQLVELRYFCGLSLAEIGALRGVSERTVVRQWERARLVLFDLLNP